MQKNRFPMNKKISSFLFIAVLIFFNFPANGQKKKFQINAFAFYNIENLFHPSKEPGKYDEDFTPTGSYNYTEEIYQKKLHNMAFALSQIGIDKVPDGPAIIGIAEVENLLALEDLVAQPELKDRNLRIVHFDSPDMRGIDVALLYNPLYFKVLSAKALPVELVENEKKIYTRDVLYVMGRMGTDTFHVFVNHWPSRYGGEAASAWRRAKAAEVNKLEINRILKENPDAKIVMMGDLNDDPVSPSLVKVLGAKGSLKDLKPGDLYNPWTAFYKKGYGTLGYNDSWNLFDQIVISYGLTNAKDGWKFYKADIFNKKFLITQFGKYKGYPHRSYSGSTWIDGYSDHFPTIIYLIKEE